MGIRERKKEARRAAIQEAGLDMFLKEGFDRASVERIASAVGIARGTFYLYYEDKLGLFEALCERLYSPIVQVLQGTAEALRSAASTAEHQFIYLQMAGLLATQGPELRPLMMLHFRESRSAGPAGEVVRRWMGRIEHLSERILSEARDQNAVAINDVYTVSLAIVGAAERLTWAWLIGDERLDRDAAALELSAVFFKGIQA
ncbi:MAG: TetR/AcrR family transcriptional regulator [Alphaproteobacteria bacterium]|nr:TetR/AcrR family transcriptional regulator [Alphaproteobacteria bacterium]